jgi:predicted kinase
MRYQRLFVTRGLPGSGKTTIAHDLIAEHIAALLKAESQALTLSAVSRDEFRRMFHGKRLGWGRQEQLVTAAQDASILALLACGSDVIVHDTNLPDASMRRFERLAEQAGAKVEVIDLRGVVDLEECIRRDRARLGDECVGEDVIYKMHNEHLANPRRTARAAVSAGRVKSRG